MTYCLLAYDLSFASAAVTEAPGRARRFRGEPRPEGGETVIWMAVVDDRGGMLFGGRRQSQDRALRRRLLEVSAQSCLWVNHFTEGQFLQDLEMAGETAETLTAQGAGGGSGFAAGQLRVDDAFLEKASHGEYCFVENVAAAPYEGKIEQIFLFRWNRRYPGDFFFDIDLSDGNWNRVSSEDFAGFSHEKITMEVYSR